MISSTSYSHISSSPLFRDRAAYDLFSRVYARGQWLQIWSFLTRKPRSLLPLNCIDEGCIENFQVKAGIQSVPISQIRGSENRFHDFDCDFYPLTDCTRDRWQGIASARLRGKNLPPVILIQVGDLYFVRDGHHRISVARAVRDTVVEARVIVWQINESISVGVTSTRSTCSPLDRLRGIRQNRRVQQHIRKVINLSN